MKKSLVARGITGIVASLLGVAAVGCSAETGDYAENEVGETSQAVTLTPTLPAAASGVMSCTVHDSGVAGGKDYVLYLGGVDNTFLAALNTIDAMDTSNNTLVGKGAGQPLNGKTLSAARGFGRAVTDSNGDCWVIGGTTKTDNAAAASTVIDKIHVNNNVWTISQPVTLANSRADFAIEKCGSGASQKFIIVGGQSAGTYRNSVEVLDPAGAIATVPTTLSAGRSAIHFAALNSSFDKFVAVGGEDINGISSKIDVITVSGAACTASSQVTVAELVDSTSGANPPAKLSLATPRAYGAALVHDQLSLGGAHKDQFAIAAGIDNTLAVTATVLNLEIVDWTTPKGTFRANLNNINTSTASPMVVYNGTTPYLIGGADKAYKATATASVSAVQSYTGLNGSDTWTLTNAATALLTPRWAPSAVFASSNSKFYVAGGVNFGAAVQSSIESF